MIRFDWYQNSTLFFSATSVERYRNGRFFYYTCIYIHMYAYMRICTRARAKRGAEGDCSQFEK